MVGRRDFTFCGFAGLVFLPRDWGWFPFTGLLHRPAAGLTRPCLPWWRLLTRPHFFAMGIGCGPGLRPRPGGPLVGRLWRAHLSRGAGGAVGNTLGRRASCGGVTGPR